MTVYQSVLDVIEGMEAGESKQIAVPEKLFQFRKHLTEISQKRALKFNTRIIEGKLRIMRVKYSNIFSKELE